MGVCFVVYIFLFQTFLESFEYISTEYDTFILTNIDSASLIFNILLFESYFILFFACFKQ